MDYVIGSVAALVTGNVTPNRPRLVKRALTPTKHQPSPNVTPKSEFVEDRSIFLSPSMQKKKAIVKKSPKRIFQHPDLNTTDNGDGEPTLTSPKADRVKKHLKDELDSDNVANKSTTEPKSPKNKGKNKKESIAPEESSQGENGQISNENTPKKKKKKNNSVSEYCELPPAVQSESIVTENTSSVSKSPKKMKKKLKSVMDNESNKENDVNKNENETPISNMSGKTATKQSKKLNNLESSQTMQGGDKIVNNAAPKKKNKKRKKKPKQQAVEDKSVESSVTVAQATNKENLENNQVAPKKKNRKRKKSKPQQNKPEAMETDQPASDNEEDNETNVKQSKKSKHNNVVNPNAVTDKESDSEHESDNEIESENEEINKKVFESEPAADESSDEDEEAAKKELPLKQKAETKKDHGKEKTELSEEADIKRTLFVGNVPFSTKVKKDIKKIFNKHGQIETIRIRTVPVKDGRYTPKLAVIKNELHPERTTVNVYVKYVDPDSVEKALSENNTVLNEHHLRVSRSSHTGAEHDPKCSIFLGNLPFAIEDEALRQKFENCGEIESVRIIRDKKTNAGKGFGYVNFTSKDGVELALALTEEDLTIKNRIIRVKRCTQLTHKQKQSSDKVGFKKPFNQNQRDRGDQRIQGNQRPHQSFQRGNQGFQKGNQGGPRGNQSFQRGNQGSQRGSQGPPRQWNKDEEGTEGAHRRIMHKRKNQDSSATDGPPSKKQNIIQGNKEKKSRKEFVGMTAEKKKKRKFDKGQKKKKALSEILTK